MNKYILVFSLLTTITSITANAAMIDDFNGGSMTVNASNTPQTKSYSHAFSGERTISITKTGPLGASAVVLPSPGIFAHSADALTSATSIIKWSNTSSEDLTDGRTDSSFALDILSIDQGDIALTVFILDLLGNGDSVTLTNAGTGIQHINFTSFLGIDFTQIKIISLEITGEVASDLTIDSFSTVPTPSVLVLLVMGLIALGFNHRIKI